MTDNTLNTQSYKVGIVVSLFNNTITKALLEGALEQFSKLGILSEDITVVEVPGAIEIPFFINRLARTAKFDIFVALGAVVRGETTHYDYVCEQASNGCQRVSLDFDVPVVFGVLTVENDSQAWDRIDGKHGHKGRDAADCAVSMLQTLKLL
jgi:6,7-dimethyl-8-ribityllumazine synthase